MESGEGVNWYQRSWEDYHKIIDKTQTYTLTLLSKSLPNEFEFSTHPRHQTDVNNLAQPRGIDQCIRVRFTPYRETICEAVIGKILGAYLSKKTVVMWLSCPRNQLAFLRNLNPPSFRYTMCVPALSIQQVPGRWHGCKRWSWLIFYSLTHGWHLV